MTSQMSGFGMQQGQDVKDELKQRTGEVIDQARQQTGEVAQQATEKAREMAEQQKSRAAEGLNSVANALRSTGRELHGGEQARLGDFADRAADQVERFAGQLRDKSVNEIVYEAERFARREPELFIGGAVVLGLLAARFFKSSGARRQSMRGMEGQGSYGYNYGQQYGTGEARLPAQGYGTYGQTRPAATAGYTQSGTSYGQTGTPGSRPYSGKQGSSYSDMNDKEMPGQQRSTERLSHEEDTPGTV